MSLGWSGCTWRFPQQSLGRCLGGVKSGRHYSDYCLGPPWPAKASIGRWMAQECVGAKQIFFLLLPDNWTYKIPRSLYHTYFKKIKTYKKNWWNFMCSGFSAVHTSISRKCSSDCLLVCLSNVFIFVLCVCVWHSPYGYSLSQTAVCWPGNTPPLHFVMIPTHTHIVSILPYKLQPSWCAAVCIPEPSYSHRPSDFSQTPLVWLPHYSNDSTQSILHPRVHFHYRLLKVLIFLWLKAREPTDCLVWFMNLCCEEHWNRSRHQSNRTEGYGFAAQPQ